MGGAAGGERRRGGVERLPGGDLRSRAFSRSDEAEFSAGEDGWEAEEAVTGKKRPKPQFPPLYNDSEEDRKQAIILRLSNLINCFRHRGWASSRSPLTTLEATQGQILSQSPTDATRFWWHLYGI